MIARTIRICAAAAVLALGALVARGQSPFDWPVHDLERPQPTIVTPGTPYRAHAAKLPLRIQDHENPVRFRNIWVRELQPRAGESE